MKNRASQSNLPLIIALFFLGTLLSSGCQRVNEAVNPLQAARHRSYAEFYAPIIFQDTDPTCRKCDYLTKINYDGDYVAKNNWQNLARYNSVPAYVYYSFSETDTHIFLSYFFFHPRDWGIERGPVNIALSEHENDLEGILLVIKKGLLNSEFDLVGMETQAHNQQYQFAYCPDRNGDGSIDPSLVDGSQGEDVDGCILVYQAAKGRACNGLDEGCVEAFHRDLDLPSLTSGNHVMVSSQANGHGVSACIPGDQKNPLDMDCLHPQPGDGLIYYNGETAQEPLDQPGAYEQKVSYELIAMDAGTLSPGNKDEDQGLWYLRNYIGDNRIFARWGNIRGDDDDGPDMDCGAGLAKCFQNAARAPWVWDDPDDNQVFIGDIFCDPAFAFDSHVDGDFESLYSVSYADHSYFTHQFSLTNVKVNQASCDQGTGNDCDLFFTVSGGGELFIGQGTWKKNNTPAGEWIPWFIGGEDASGPTVYGQHSSTRTICRQGGRNTAFLVQGWDADTPFPNVLGQEYRPPVPSDQLLSEQNLGAVSIHYRLDAQPEARRALIWPKIFVLLYDWVKGFFQ